ncbi:hypothetical protein [Pseudomonas sp. LD120]|uniref:hypothetical protein n=1 Tax=Pseudomonas sp. LD120 TaxID=485751 RepID=UPI001357CE29|nr:hypothetical protein [Pseudomonas sp. LD120]KAF0866504.1 hypothetical protein PLD_04235 [Pseudomonas sp. LD120]
MSNGKCYASGLVLALWALVAAAEELPQSSILKRYGVSPEQLPAAQPAPPIKEQATPSRFKLQAEQPVVNLRLGDGQAPVSTGNISIDNAQARERERCQQMRDALSKRGKAQSLICSPGQGPFPWSP